MKTHNYESRLQPHVDISKASKEIPSKHDNDAEDMSESEHRSLWNEREPANLYSSGAPFIVNIKLEED